ncbi:MAG: tRNA-binding protein [Verrucomicrobia bacterium CG_4_10_14_3_um_filter_43_23]|nr:MAG: tRNA-binding protein [Verrucomicrobia bacterium CG_4_10_14_3_um_filter_43_23]PJA44850.1 MAG: tRNA-binding protein [Verrucomicrobia bacterium CG_4_9_14_3_um_filter_43_20]
MNMQSNITFDEFEKVDIRSGTVIKAEVFPKARKPAYKVWVDFGEHIGTKQTSAQITDLYAVDDLPGMQVLGAINLGTKNIAGFVSEFLLLGFEDVNQHISLVAPTKSVPNGKKLK